MSEGMDIIAGLEDALAHVQGKPSGVKITEVIVPDMIDVAAIRKSQKMSQKAFAAQFGFTLKALQHWEQNRRIPEAPTRAYLKVIATNPEAVIAALHS